MVRTTAGTKRACAVELALHTVRVGALEPTRAVATIFIVFVRYNMTM